MNRKTKRDAEQIDHFFFFPEWSDWEHSHHSIFSYLSRAYWTIVANWQLCWFPHSSLRKAANKIWDIRKGSGDCTAQRITSCRLSRNSCKWAISASNSLRRYSLCCAMSLRFIINVPTSSLNYSRSKKKKMKGRNELVFDEICEIRALHTTEPSPTDHDVQKEWYLRKSSSKGAGW